MDKNIPNTDPVLGLSSEEARRRLLHDGYNEEFDCFMLNTDKVCDELEERMDQGGVVLEAHSCDFFPEQDMMIRRKKVMSCIF